MYVQGPVAAGAIAPAPESSQVSTTQAGQSPTRSRIIIAGAVAAAAVLISALLCGVWRVHGSRLLRRAEQPGKGLAPSGTAELRQARSAPLVPSSGTSSDARAQLRVDSASRVLTSSSKTGLRSKQEASQGSRASSQEDTELTADPQRFTATYSTSWTTATRLSNPCHALITTQQATDTAKLLTALDNIVHSEPPELFAHAYMLLNERVAGGQAVVQFARGRDGGFQQFAIKFFMDPSCRDFETEAALYAHAAIRKTLPALVHASANVEGVLRSRSGFAFPPFMVLERGTTLARWKRSQQSFRTVLHMFYDLAECLAVVHGAGRVHRDLKPGNALLMLHSHRWRLLDFGIAAERGAIVPPRCTLSYAAPEVLRAYEAKAALEVHPAQDIWALGVIVFESLSASNAFPVYLDPKGLFAAAAGDAPYPWEEAEQEAAFVKSKMRPAVAACLQRDPQSRPSAQQLLDMLDALGTNATAEAAQ